MVLRSFFPEVGLFWGLTSQEPGKVERLCRMDEYGPGDMIFSEGLDAEDICVVVDGQVELRFKMPGRLSTSEHTIKAVSR